MTPIKSAIVLATVLAGGVIAYGEINPAAEVANAQAVADAATCHTLTDAAAGYFAEYDTLATNVADLVPYVTARADVLAQYTVTAGVVSGPGCP